MNRSRETKRNGGQLFHENEKKTTKKNNQRPPMVLLSKLAHFSLLRTFLANELMGWLMELPLKEFRLKGATILAKSSGTWQPYLRL